MNSADDTNTTAAFSLTYVGQDVDDNSMDAQDLITSVQSMHALMLRSNQLVNGKQATCSLRIKATSAGSFEIAFLLSLAAYGTQLLSEEFAMEAPNLKQLLFGGRSAVGGVVEAFKRLRGREIESNTRLNDTIRIKAKELEVDVPVRTFEVLQDSSVQHLLQSVYSPLQRGGIDTIAIRDETGDLVSLDSSDVDFEQASIVQQEEENVIDIPRQNLTLVAPNLEDPGAKWRLSPGNHNTHWYSILDQGFLNDVIQGRTRFGSGDVLITQVRIKQKISTDNKITSEYEIVRVLEHHGPEEQMPLL